MVVRLQNCWEMMVQPALVRSLTPSLPVGAGGCELKKTRLQAPGAHALDPSRDVTSALASRMMPVPAPPAAPFVPPAPPLPEVPLDGPDPALPGAPPDTPDPPVPVE